MTLNLPLARERLRSQWIAPPMLALSPVHVVDRLGGMQAQDYAQAVWAIGLRCGKTLAEVEADIRAHKIVRLWLMRQTIHFAAREAVHAILHVTRPRMLQGMTARLRELELDAATLDRSSALLVDALRTHGELDRAALLRLLDEGGISTAGQRGYYMLGVAGIRGLIAMGVESKKNAVFFALESAGSEGEIRSDEGLAWLVTRFFNSHDPATLEDFARWTGVTLGEARDGLKKCQAFVKAPDDMGMIRGWGEHYGEKQHTQGVNLLPGFDEYFIGYKDRSPMLDPAHADRICPGGNGVFKPMIVSDGEICGVWAREVKRDRVIITPAPFRTLSAEERDGVEAAAGRYGAFLEMSASVKWG